jgi:hypothetical protein
MGNKSLSNTVSSLTESISTEATTLAEKFDHLISEVETALITCEPVAIENNDVAPRQPGIYAIFLKGDLVYLGAALQLKHRLREHRKTVRQATAIDSSDVTYQFAVCARFPSAAVEGRLIEHYAPAWNKTGFGRRPRADSRHQKPSVWDYAYGAENRTIDPNHALR